MKQSVLFQNHGMNKLDYYPVSAWMPSGTFPSYLGF